MIIRKGRWVLKHITRLLCSRINKECRKKIYDIPKGTEQDRNMVTQEKISMNKPGHGISGTTRNADRST